MKKILLFFVMFIAISLSNIVHATAIYSSFGSNDTYSSSRWALGQMQRMAIPFTTNGSYIFESIDFVGSYLFGSPDVSLPDQPMVHLALGANEPGTILESLELLNLSNTPTLFSLSSLTNTWLSAGQHYWVIFDSGNVPALFAINLNTLGYDSLWTDNGDGVWHGPSMSTAPVARVNGTIAPVPEPSTFILCVIGLATVGILYFLKFIAKPTIQNEL